MSNSDMDYDAIISGLRINQMSKAADAFDQLRARVAELESERDKWQRRAYAASDEIEGLEAENGRLRSIADDLEQRFTSGNDGPVREG